MNMALFYGFHDIYMVMPMLLGFFIFFERKQWALAFLCFALSLLIKETVPVFWAGVGLIWILWGRRRTGIVLFVLSCLYWLLVMKVLIPMIGHQATYEYASRFNHLGNSLEQIILSPFLRPLVLLEYLLRPGCLYFIALLLLPVFMTALTHPLLLGGAGVTLLFICLQDSNQLQNINMQYQAETVILVFITATYAWQRIQRGQPGWWLRFCQYRLPTPPVSRMAAAALLTTLLTAGMAEFFFGDLPGGRSYRSNLLLLPDMTDVIAELHKLIPPGERINTSHCLGGSFLLRNPISHNMENPTDDWVLLELNSHFDDQRQMDRLRQKLRQQGYGIVYLNVQEPFHIVVYRRGVPDAVEAALINTENWQQNEDAGAAINNPRPTEIEVKCQTVALGELRRFIISARPLKKVDCDYNFLVMFGAEDKPPLRFINAFGNGVTPAFMSGPDKTFIMTFDLTAEFSPHYECFCQRITAPTDLDRRRVRKVTGEKWKILNIPCAFSAI